MTLIVIKFKTKKQSPDEMTAEKETKYEDYVTVENSYEGAKVDDTIYEEIDEV